MGREERVRGVRAPSAGRRAAAGGEGGGIRCKLVRWRGRGAAEALLTWP